MGIVNFLFGLIGIVSKVLTFFSNRNLQKEGAEAQANKETQVSVTIQTKIAQAEAQTDKTKAAIIKSAEKGEF